MGDDLDAVERAEVLICAVVLALVDSAFDAHIGSVGFHVLYLPYIRIDEAVASSISLRITVKIMYRYFPEPR